MREWCPKMLPNSTFLQMRPGFVSGRLFWHMLEQFKSNYVLKRVSINPKKMNTDAVEWFFGDVRQFIPGSTSKVSAPKGMGHRATKASACTNGRHLVHGNNKKAADALCRPKKF